MFRQPEDTLEERTTRGDVHRSIVVAGPGSGTTIPGIVVSEIVLALAHHAPVTRVEVDLGAESTVGLHRAPSLAIAHGGADAANVLRHRAPSGSRYRAQAFRRWIGPDVGSAVAFVWPGIDNSWVKQFLQIAQSQGARTVVACASLPAGSKARPSGIADLVSRADLVLVGEESDARSLRSALGAPSSRVEVQRALSLHGRSDRGRRQRITAFLPRDGAAALATLLAAFDAIPEAWVHDYRLKIVMRYSDPALPEMVANSYHADHVELIDVDLSTPDLEELCASSSILSVADPAFDSRAFSKAVDCGIATVVLSNSDLPEVGRGYVGGLLADLQHPASVHVALAHALRLAELGFPEPDSWDELAARLRGVPRAPTAEPRVREQLPEPLAKG